MPKAMDPSFMDEWFKGEWVHLPKTVYYESSTLSLGNKKEALAVFGCIKIDHVSTTEDDTYAKNLVICVLLGHLRYAYQITKPLTFDDLPNLEEEFEAARKWSSGLWVVAKEIKSFSRKNRFTDQDYVDWDINHFFEDVAEIKAKRLS